MRKFYPKVGLVFTSREELVEKLEASGWTFEGQDTSLDKKGRITGYNVGVDDKKKDLWLMVDLVPFNSKVKVSKVRKLKLSDYKK